MNVKFLHSPGNSVIKGWAVRLVLFLAVGIAGDAASQTGTPYLSNLSAGANSPLYTTYAAAKNRSEFTLDEGYCLQYDDSTRGADFTTDTAGDICLAFKEGASYVYKTGDLSRRPVITVSYPDLVKYNYYPLPDIRAEVTFLVYSSHFSVQSVNISNESRSNRNFQIIPFLRNDYRIFNDVRFFPGRNAITFEHREIPDGWVLSHEIPYIDPIQDVFLSATHPDRMTSYRSYRWGKTDIPQQFNLQRNPGYVITGTLYHADSGKCRHRVKLVAGLQRLPGKILTETAPVWGSSQKNISGNGRYRLELGNFPGLREGDRFTVRAFCSETGERADFTGRVENIARRDVARQDLLFSGRKTVSSPEKMVRDIWGSGTEVRLAWKHSEPAAFYRVYRRNHRAAGFYELIADSLHRDFYTDKNIQEDPIYSYLIFAVDSSGKMSAPSAEMNNIAGSDFLTDIRYPDQLNNRVKDYARVLAMPQQISLQPGESKEFRYVRGVARPDMPADSLLAAAESLLDLQLDRFLRDSEQRLGTAPRPDFSNPETEMLYWSAFNLMQQVMMPPEGRCDYNYYLFSREPSWGWGHGGQVFHESLTMLSYAYLDARSAMNSQRVYRNRQHESGYINYRTGPYLDETIPSSGQMTTSAPWYSWENLEIYKISGDKAFLRDMYRSGRDFYKYYVSNRDRDEDGLCEWGGHAVLESVRDARVAVWDEVGWPANFEGPDLNSMLVMEAKSLAEMARELGKPAEARRWEKEAAERSRKINEFMWDDESGFYYQVDKTDHDFTFKTENDLKRQEIIGFLPLWAGIASGARAERLVKNLTDPQKFWRKFGVPSLAADDPCYNPRGYWNGPVWVEWNYLIVRGLLNYGYTELARELTERVAQNMISRLKANHNLWEFYSPDSEWGGHHRQYIWAGIINRMLLDVMAKEADGSSGGN